MVALIRNFAMAAMLLGLLLVMYGPTSALALSGGVVGGGSFSSGGSSYSSSSSSSSSSSPSSSYSGYYYPSSSGSSGSAASSSGSSDSAASSEFMIIFGVFLGAGLLVFGVTLAISCFCNKNRDKPSSLSYSVLTLQVGLLGSAPTLQTDFNRIGETADTSTPQGRSNVLAGATTTLIQNLNYCISGYSSVALNQSIQDAEKCFNQLSNKERAKFDKETLVNLNNIKVKSSTSKAAKGSQSEYIAVTILVAAQGILYKLPTIDDSGTLKEALQNLKSIPSGKILSVKLLWTPQEEDDNLSEQKLHKNYPLLKTFKDYSLVEVVIE